MDNKVPNNQEEAVETLKGYVSNNRGMMVAIGIGAGLYLLGRHHGTQNGYLRGYTQNFKDMVTVSRKL